MVSIMQLEYDASLPGVMKGSRTQCVLHYAVRIRCISARCDEG